MRTVMRAVSILLFTLVSNAYAQEAQPGANEGRAGDTTEDTNARQGGFFGIGGQKPLQRVKGIPLPNNRSSSRPLFASAQAGAPRDMNPPFSQRRGKPMMGELTTDFPARMIYLNGKNVSSVREQQLNEVNVRIDANGNIHISAPHYEVQESTHYRPLLPNDIPRVSKPAPSNSDEPLFSQKSNRQTGQSDEARNRPGAASVPPIEAEDEPGVEPAAPAQGPGDSAKAAPAAGENKAAPAGQKL